jgi:15-cis-phytoene synthase
LRDRDLVRLYWPAELRPAFDALFDIDDAMADVVARSTQPALAAIKLAWWRERLQELDRGKIPAEPRLKAAVAELLPRGISGAELAELEEGWAALLEETPDLERALNRGAILFGLGARLIGSGPPLLLAPAGRLYAAGVLHRLGLVPAASWAVTPSGSVPVSFRRLTGLAVLAKRDLRRPEAEGTPGRAWALLRHRLTGRFPR